MTGTCLTCGLLTTDLEAHHVAGRHNHRTLTVAVCSDCHRVVSTWQRASGVELEDTAPLTALDATRALLVGVADLLRLFGQRHAAAALIGAPLATHTARAMSKILDGFGPLDRPGRWVPDPTVPPTEAVPVGWSIDTAGAQVRELAFLLREVASILGDPSALFTALTDDPAQVCAAFDCGSPELVELGSQLVEHVAHCQQMILRLLTVDSANGLDPQLIDDLETWYLAAYGQLERMFAVALEIKGDGS
jgi:hypothetical protein